MKFMSNYNSRSKKKRICWIIMSIIKIVKYNSTIFQIPTMNVNLMKKIDKTKGEIKKKEQ
jgi:hypothetical protein